MKWWHSLCFILYFLSGNAQNLIPNPGFENVFTEIDYQWVQPQGPYYHYEKTDSASLHPAHSGAYVNGLCMYNNRENEFLHIKLLKPLEKGVEYKMRLMARLMRAKCFNDHLQELIGVHFGMKPLDTHIPGDLYLEPQVNLVLPDSNRFDWFELTSTFTAQGGERYLTIGYFAATQTEELRRKNRALRDPEMKNEPKEKEVDNSWLYLPPEEQKKYIKNQKKKAKKRRKKEDEPAVMEDFSKPEADWKYLPERGKDPNSIFFMVRYYFDDFCLTAIPDSGEINCESTTPPPVFEKGKSITLRNVFFKTDESELLNESIVQLNALVRILEDNQDMEIELRGYTDDRGDSSYNQELSERRAQAVKDWLEKNGIAKSRVTSRGFGEENPIETNTTEAGRTRNRRVEFFIVNM